MPGGDLVLISGISGFIAKHTALAVLRAGFHLRGTVRSAGRRDETLRTLAANGADVSRVEIVEADLSRDEGWTAAVAGCRFVLHMASPFPLRVPKDKFALTPLARDGTLRVLQAAAEAGVERAVVTSSVAAVYYGHENRANSRFTEADFSDVESPSIGAYAVSKTLAEQAAWAFVSGRRLQLATVNPSFVLGPLVDDEFGTSISLVRMMMRGRFPLVPRIMLGVVDVRDVAEAHLKAMTVPAAAGHRFIASAGPLSMMEMGRAVAEAVPSIRRRLPRLALPDAAVRIAARFSAEAAQTLPELGRTKHLVAGPAQKILGVAFLPPEEAVAAAARSLFARGLAG